jgi:hypothetical protein
MGGSLPPGRGDPNPGARTGWNGMARRGTPPRWTARDRSGVGRRTSALVVKEVNSMNETLRLQAIEPERNTSAEEFPTWSLWWSVYVNCSTAV